MIKQHLFFFFFYRSSEFKLGGFASLTSDTEHGGALGPSEGVLRGDGVLSHVFGAYA